MNAFEVLFDHHVTLRGLCKSISALEPDSAERRALLDQLLVELDIHMRIEDDLFYPAVNAATELVAIAHAEHRQVFDQLAIVLRTRPGHSRYEQEWQSFVTVLDAHAEEEERDLCPPPVDLDDKMMDELGDRMRARIDRLRNSRLQRMHVKARATLLRAF